MTRPFRRLWSWATDPEHGEEIKLRKAEPEISAQADDECDTLRSSDVGAAFAFAWYSMVRSKAECDQLDCIPCQIVTDTIDRTV